MMATSTAMQTILGTSAATSLITNRSRLSPLIPAKYVPRLRGNASRPVRCMAELDDKKEKSTDPVTTPPNPQPLSNPTPKPKVSTNFSDVFAFSGPAPERINGRLAMIGFVAAMAVELSKGQDVFSQISDGGVTWFLGASIVLSVASLIPLFKGVSVESKSEGLMTSDAELWNGRFAMLGLVALAFTEFVKGGTLL